MIYDRFFASKKAVILVIFNTINLLKSFQVFLGEILTIPLMSLFEHRSLFVHFSILDIKMQHKGTYLGLLWKPNMASSNLLV